MNTTNRIALLLTFSTVVAQAAPQVMCDTPLFDAGEVRIGTKLSHTFVIKNTGDEALKINEVKPGCGCTTANLAKSELAPGESTNIDATLDLTMRRGKQDKTIHVKSNDPKNPDYQLLIRVNSKDDFRLEPDYIDLGSITTGAEIVKKAVLHVTSEQGYKITELAPVKNVVKATWESAPDDKTHTITIVVPPQTAAGTFYDNVQIRTNNKDSMVLPLQVVGTVQAGLALAPAEITVEPSSGKISRTVAVRGGTIKEFSITSATFDDPSASVEILPSTSFGQQVRVTFSAVGAGLNGKTLNIKTDAPGYGEMRVPVKVAPALPAAASTPAAHP